MEPIYVFCQRRMDKAEGGAIATSGLAQGTVAKAVLGDSKKAAMHVLAECIKEPGRRRTMNHAVTHAFKVHLDISAGTEWTKNERFLLVKGVMALEAERAGALKKR